MTVHVKANEAWDFFEENSERLGDEMVEIASEGMNDISVYITEEEDFPCVIVTQKDVEKVHEGCLNRKDLETTLEKIYLKYLVQDNDEEEIEKEIEEREDEIFQAFSDLINVLTGDPAEALEFCSKDDKIVHIVDHVIEYLAIDCGYSIRRPMWVSDDDLKEDVFSEYPYEEYEFGEEELSK